MQTHTVCLHMQHAEKRTKKSDGKEEDVQAKGCLLGRRERREVMMMMMMMVVDSTQHTRNISPHWSVIVILWKEQ